MVSFGTDFKMHAKWQGSNEEPAAKDFVARNTHTIMSGIVGGINWNVIKCKECLRNCPEAVVRQATNNLDLQVWKSLEDSLPKLFCIGSAEAYVTQDSVSSRIFSEKKRYDLQSPNGRLHEKPLAKRQKVERIQVLVLASVSREHLALRKCMMCARNMGAHIRRNTLEVQRYKKMGREFGFPYSQERCKEN
jgi:hypothetical protein